MNKRGLDEGDTQDRRIWRSMARSPDMDKGEDEEEEHILIPQCKKVVSDNKTN